MGVGLVEVVLDHQLDSLVGLRNVVKDRHDEHVIGEDGLSRWTVLKLYPKFSLLLEVLC